MIRKEKDMACEVRENMRGGAGTVSLRHLFRAEEFTAPVRLCAMLTLPAGAGIGSHEHLKEDEVYYITRGSGILDDGNTQTRVSRGDAILTGKGESHAIFNDGEEDLEFFAFIACYPEGEET
ncbi:MAG: cupin domain-containing protein [Candidatus Hydrogenedens sp.]|jgi:mannose-6-phosphate isomerase-like protein (cupin superfamily)|nr:cupin domain-containing protein [Candidatus Hydrogenedens sp.]